jgi:GNAT superfamily N-acetyltransferase
MDNHLNLKKLTGKDILPYVEELGKLRITVFHEYPYLYIGDMDYEKKYLNRYIACNKSLAVLAFNDNSIVGVSTGIPMQYEIDEFKAPFIEKKYDISTIFYLGESVLLRPYRGQGIYRHFFNEREATARACGCQIATFCSVDRPINHPQKPVDYHSLEPIWKRYGYQKHPELSTLFEWKEIGETTASPKKLIFWIKNLL